MDQKSRHLHAVHGRRFDILMLQFEIKMCDCCGQTMPVQEDMLLDKNGYACDPLTKERTNIRRHHLAEQFHDAWKCSCDKFCKGEQFYCSKRSKQIREFEKHHNNKSPEQLMEDEASTVTAALLCSGCYGELTGKNDSLQLARSLSRRNGFGPIKRILKDPDASQEEPTDPALSICQRVAQMSPEQKMYELHMLLDVTSAAEEAACRTILPLLSLVRLKHGNIGSKGSTTCVRQEARLMSVLPNLPSECAVILVERQDQRSETPITLTSYKFSRRKIELLLYLLQATALAPWAATCLKIDETRLAQWPEEGNLCEQCDRVRSNQNEQEDDSADSDEEQEDTVPREENGPAPLQNDVEPDETFGFVDVQDSNTTIQENLVTAPLQLAQVAERLQQDKQSTQQQPQPGLPGVQFRNNNRIAVVQQNEVLPINGIVNMKTHPSAWTCAFPTLFRPIYEDGEWRVYGDITATDRNRDRSVGWTDWCKWSMWRSDGAPVKHPTHAMVLQSETTKDQLMKQGRVALHSDEHVDANMSVDDFLDQYFSAEARRRQWAQAFCAKPVLLCRQRPRHGTILGFQEERI